MSSEQNVVGQSDIGQYTLSYEISDILRSARLEGLPTALIVWPGLGPCFEWRYVAACLHFPVTKRRSTDSVQ